MKSSLLLLAAGALLSGALHAKTETYEIDPTHSSVKFSIRHFVAKTTGSFGEFEGTITVDRDDMTKSSVSATIKVPSVDTDSEKRDGHLQADDYFDSAKHPLMTFESTQWEQGDGENMFKVTGNLTIRGKSKPVTLDVELLGFGDGMQGAYLSGWEASTTIDRTQWGVSGGQPAVGDEVDITINIEAIRHHNLFLAESGFCLFYSFIYFPLPSCLYFVLCSCHFLICAILEHHLLSKLDLPLLLLGLPASFYFFLLSW